MSDELRKYLREQEQQKKEKAMQNLMARSKQHEFTNAFRILMKTVVHSAMLKNLEALRGQGRTAKQVREYKSMVYDYEKYDIRINNKKVIIIIYGNYDIQKVCISTEYFENTPPSAEKISVKKKETQHDLAEITAAFLNTFTIDLVKELLPSE